MERDDWSRILRRYGYRVEMIFEGAVLLRDTNGNPHRFEPHPNSVTPAELAMLTRDFLRLRGFEIEPISSTEAKIA